MALSWMAHASPVRRPRPLHRAVLAILVAVGASLLSWTGGQHAVTAVIAAYRRYHSGPNYGLYAESPMSAGQQSSGMLMPPVAWLYQDYEGAMSACPVLLAICAAATAGYVLQHWFGKCLPFERVAAFYPPTLKAGEVWRPFTHVFLHSDFGHLVVNLLHILNTLDLEGTPKGSGYPNAYSLGSHDVAAVAAVSTAFGALVASVPNFGAVFEGASALCFGLDGALLTACGLILGAGQGASLQSFLEMRGMYAAIHMGIDIMRAFGGSGGTVGHFAHLAGFMGGMLYVVAALPTIGGKPVPTIPCLTRGASGRFVEEKCLVLFTPKYSMPVASAQNYAYAILTAGVLAALLNAFVFHRRVHASADGFSLFVKAPGTGASNRGGRRLGSA